MVVARRTPVAPVASRTASSQPLPRATKAHMPPSTSANGESSSNGLSPNSKSPKKSTNQKQKSKKGETKRPPRPPSLLSRLFLPLLLIFTAYAFTTCPSDTVLCRSLSTYRAHVLEPYILPPIYAALTHPVVRPHLDTAQTTLAPYVAHLAAAEQKTRPYTTRALALTTTAASTLHTRFIHPTYNAYILPHYYTHVHPHLAHLRALSDPYTTALHNYHIAHIRPYLIVISTHTSRLLKIARPFLVRLVRTTNAYIHLAWTHSKPHLARLWAGLRPRLYILWGQVKRNAQQLVAYARELRREFVDPPLLMIWEKVIEVGGKESDVPVATPLSTKSTAAAVTASSSTPPPEASQAVSVLLASEGSVTGAASVIDEIQSSVAAAPLSSSAVSSEEAVRATTDSQIVSTTQSASTPAPTPVPSETAEPTLAVETPSEVEPATTEDEEPALSASAASIISASASGSSSLSDASVVPALSSSLPPAPVETATEAYVTPSVPAIEIQAVAEPEFDDDFLLQLGLDLDDDADVQQVQGSAQVPLDDTSAHVQPSISAAAPTPNIPSPEEAARLAALATAEKRRAITRRHATWQSQLDTFIVEKEGEVRRGVESFRVTKAEEIKNTGKKLVNDVEADGEKLVKGLEGYLKGVKGRLGGVSEREKEKAKWEKVVGRVEEKFEERVREVQESVHDWYVEVVQGEIEQMKRASSEVKSLAEKAQADLGLDYAWLDDVTYEDWQRYHDLMRTSEQFTDRLNALQNGTATVAPLARGAVVAVLDVLDADMGEVVDGFGVRVGGVRRDGVALFEVSEEENVEEPRVSILPIDVGVGKGEEEKVVDVEGVFVGRGEEEVVQAFERAQVHEEL